jgi:two-component system nitrate/nitrite response regulator NarL
MSRICRKTILLKVRNANLIPEFSFEMNTDGSEVFNGRRPPGTGKHTQGEPMNVLIISNVRLHRDGLACLLERVPTITLVEAIDVDAALDGALRKTVDAVLLDLPSTECQKVVHRLRRSRRRMRIVAVGVREVESEVLACAAAGIEGYVPVGAGTEDLVAVLHSVMREELVCSPKVAASLYNWVGMLRTVSSEPLTARELEVVDLMNEGLSNKEIARRLGIEACTAKNHVQNILLKLNVHRRGQATAKLRALIRDRFDAADPTSLSSAESVVK